MPHSRFLETGFQPGFGNMRIVQGVGPISPYELVISTDEALEHAYLFETSLPGIPFRGAVSCTYATLRRALSSGPELTRTMRLPRRSLKIQKRPMGFSQKPWKELQPHLVVARKISRLPRKRLPRKSLCQSFRQSSTPQLLMFSQRKSPFSTRTGKKKQSVPAVSRKREADEMYDEDERT